MSTSLLTTTAKSSTEVLLNFNCRCARVQNQPTINWIFAFVWQ